MSEAVSVRVEAGVGILELARPEKFNCLSMAAWGAIGAALAGFERPGSGVRVVLIQAQGKHFCTGADLDEVQGLRADPAQLAEFIGCGHRVLRAMEASPLPIVVACQGLCLAGGSQRLTRLVGLRRAMDLYLSARWIDADTAAAWGLVNEVVEPDALNGHALAWCKTAAERSRSGLAVMKRLARQGLDLPLTDGLALEEGVAVQALLEEDVSEGLAAFNARRKPQFKEH